MEFSLISGLIETFVVIIHYITFLCENVLPIVLIAIEFHIFLQIDRIYLPSVFMNGVKSDSFSVC